MHTHISPDIIQTGNQKTQENFRSQKRLTRVANPYQSRMTPTTKYKLKEKKNFKQME